MGPCTIQSIEGTIPDPQVRMTDRRLGFFRQCFPSVGALLLALVVCVAAPVLLISVHIHENPTFSPIDEATHYDYVNRMAEGSLPRLGQRLLPSTLHAMSCIGQSGITYPPCPGTSNPNNYGVGAYQYEAQQPPAYYALTVPVRWVGVHVFRMATLTATRAVGALWVSLGLLILWMAGRVLEIPMRRLAPVMLLLASAPVVIYQAANVSNDAPSIFAGSLAALAAALAWRRPGRWTAPVLALVGFFVTSFKEVDIVAPVTLSALFAVMLWHRAADLKASTGSRLRLLVCGWWPNGGALLLGGVLSAASWVIIFRQLSLINPKTLPSFHALRQTRVGVSLIAREALNLWNPLNGAYAPFRTTKTGVVLGTYDSMNLESMTGTILQYLFLGAGVAGLFVRHRKWFHWLGLLSLASLFAVGLVLGIGSWRTFDIDPGLSGRYGLSGAPLLALALAAGARSRWVVAGLWVFSAVLVGLTIWYGFVG
jgi:hypothetical protein